MRLRVLGRKTSYNVQKVLWCAAELGLPVEREDYGGHFGRTREAHYLQLNPNGTVPTVIDGDLVLSESNAIVRYLCNRYGPTAFYPPQPGERALAERWMDWQIASLAEAFLPLYRGLVREARAPAELEASRARSAELFALVDHALAGRAFLAGAGPTVAEIALGPLVYRWLALPLERPDLPRLAAWYGRLEQRPAFREHVAIGLF